MHFEKGQIYNFIWHEKPAKIEILNIDGNTVFYRESNSISSQVHHLSKDFVKNLLLKTIGGEFTVINPEPETEWLLKGAL